MEGGSSTFSHDLLLSFEEDSSELYVSVTFENKALKILQNAWVFNKASVVKDPSSRSVAEHYIV
jgi:hypothetical protein